MFYRIYLYVLLKNNEVIMKIVPEEDRKAVKILLMIYSAKRNDAIL